MRNQMPSNPEAEAAVLGSIYLDSELYPEISDILSRDDFYDVRNRELWTILGECIRKGQCDLVTIKAAMQAWGKKDKKHETLKNAPKNNKWCTGKESSLIGYRLVANRLRYRFRYRLQKKKQNFQS